jgi:hypothetical protein
VVSKRKLVLLENQHGGKDELLLTAIAKPNCKLLISKGTEKSGDAEKPHIAAITVVRIPLFLQREI